MDQVLIDLSYIRSRFDLIYCHKNLFILAEIFEFDAMDEPPSMLDVEVYDFDGPFNEATSLGHAEINFVKSNISDLADVWIPLQGKLAQACQSKLHLRIFLNNTKGSNVVKEYLTKMEKEVGKKVMQVLLWVFIYQSAIDAMVFHSSQHFCLLFLFDVNVCR